MGFLDPAYLLFGLSIAALVLIYLRARARPTVEVSSLMLFEEIAAPIAKSRVLRVDLVFWLELLVLTALTLAAAGLYIKRTEPVGRHQQHALVFDLGAGMAALEGRSTRLDEAKRGALEIVSRVPAGDEFSVIGYAVDAQRSHARTSRKDEVHQAVDGLEPMAVATRPAALRAALLAARGAAQIDLFIDRMPPAGMLEDTNPDGRVKVHRVGAPGENLAIVSLEPGTPRSSEGRCVLRNFSMHSQQFELRIDANGQEVFRAPLIIEPRAQLIVPFGPLTQGGLVRARIVTPDALAADNVRYALAPGIAHADALVMSPDIEARDDLARIVLAINPNFVVTAADPVQFASSKDVSRRFALAVLHDCSDARVNAASKLFIFPEPWLERSRRPPVVPVVGSVALAELQAREGLGVLGTSVLLGPSRVVELPGWMDAIASGTGAGEHDAFPLAAVGDSRDGAVGVITFDIRDHLLLDPDRMDALVLTVDTLKRVVASPAIKIVPSGAFVSLATFAPAILTAPDSSSRGLIPDHWGRIRFRPVQAGRYTVTAKGRNVQIFANYYDAAESDLAGASPERNWGSPTERAAVHSEVRIEGETLALAAIALLLLFVESIMLARRAVRRGAGHV